MPRAQPTSRMRARLDRRRLKPVQRRQRRQPIGMREAVGVPRIRGLVVGVGHEGVGRFRLLGPTARCGRNRRCRLRHVRTSSLRTAAGSVTGLPSMRISAAPLSTGSASDSTIRRPIVLAVEPHQTRPANSPPRMNAAMEQVGDLMNVPCWGDRLAVQQCRGDFAGAGREGRRFHLLASAGSGWRAQRHAA